MRKTGGLIYLALAILVLPFTARAAAAAAGPQDDDLAAVPRISQADFKKALAAETIRVLDVRDATSYANGHIPGAQSIPLDELAEHVQELKAEPRQGQRAETGRHTTEFRAALPFSTGVR